MPIKFDDDYFDGDDRCTSEHVIQACFYAFTSQRLISFLIIMNLHYLLFSCLWMSCCPCITLLLCDECIFDYAMYVCVSIICRLSVIFE